VLTEEETVEAVIANPDVYKIFADGLKFKVEFIDRPVPEEEAEIGENNNECELLVDATFTKAL
jgi:hypothetical protein